MDRSSAAPRGENPTLFAALAGSGEGALARVLRVRLRLLPRPPHVTVHAIRAAGFEEARTIADDMVRLHRGAVLDAEVVVSGPEGAMVLVSELEQQRPAEEEGARDGPRAAGVRR